MISARPPKAPMGSPPPITLPKQVRSGSTPYAAWAPPEPSRKPVITSSKTRSAPAASQAAAQALEEARRRGDEAHVGRDRLDHHAGHVVAERRHDVVRGHDRLAHGGLGDPGRPGQAERGHAAPPGRQQRVAVAVVVAGELHDLRARPVTPRASRSAVIVASVPLFTKRTCSQLGTRSLIASASFISRAVGAPYEVPSAAAAVTAPDHLRVGVAEDDRAVALHQVDEPPALRVPDVRRPRPGPRSTACRRPSGTPAPASSRRRGSPAATARTARRWTPAPAPRT